MNLVEILTEQTRKRPKAAAIIEMHRGRDRVTTFAELDERSAKVARLLRNSGIQASDSVLIFHAMSSELYVVLLGAFRIGATAMFLDPSAGRAHIERCCELQAPRALIASPKAHLLRLTSAALRRIPRKFVVGAWVPGATPLTNAEKETPLETCERCDSDASALLTFTSGSTGLPKAAVRSHGFLLAQHHVLERHIELAAGEVDLTTLPVFLLANLASGVTSVIPDADLRAPGTVDPAPILTQMRRHGVTRCAASPRSLNNCSPVRIENRCGGSEKFTRAERRCSRGCWMICATVPKRKDRSRLRLDRGGAYCAFECEQYSSRRSTGDAPRQRVARWRADCGHSIAHHEGSMGQAARLGDRRGI